MRRGRSHRVGMTIDNSIGKQGGVGSFLSSSEKVNCAIASFQFCKAILYHMLPIRRRCAPQNIIQKSPCSFKVNSAVQSIMHGEGQATKSDEFSEKCQREGGSFSIQKLILHCIHIPLLSCPHAFLHTCSHIHYKKLRYIFPKFKRGKGRLEFSRKFIRFGTRTLP